MLADPVLALILRSAFAVLFGLGLVSKLRDFDRFAWTVASYFRDTPLSARAPSRLLAGAAILAELGALVACAPFVAPRASAAILSGLLLFYAVAMALNLLRGNKMLDCGCSIGSARQPVSWTLVARNVAMASAALLLGLPGAQRPLGLFDLLSLAAGLVLCAFLYATTNLLIANSSLVAGGAK